MIPLRDSIPAVRTPYVRNLMLVLCSAVFVLQQLSHSGLLVFEYGMVPARVFGDGAIIVRDAYGRALQLPEAALPDWLTLLSCTFLHGGWMHFLGNMLFLWIFGDNVEDRFGSVAFLLFYLGCGVAASLAHALADATSVVPTIGASGAIAGVMGAYLFLYPKSRVLALIPIGFFLMDVVLPAPFFLVYWFGLQLLQGAIDRGVGGGVAWWAHVGGFVVGAAVAGGLLLLERLQPKQIEVVLSRRPSRRVIGGRPRR
ncbi:MAG: rhomboid family intramembrane serine protease [Planctomycetota bacterium]